MINEKFKEWDSAFKSELGKLRMQLEKSEAQRNQFDEQRKQLLDRITKKDDEIQELKLKLNSQDVILTSSTDLQYEYM